MNPDIIKDEIKKNLNREVKITVHGMRGKVEHYQGILKAVFPHIFTILENNKEKSFSYRDIITKDIKIKYM